jgi:hypothetical protein
MILGNTITSQAVGASAVTVLSAADDNPVQGYGAVGNGQQWVGTPGLANAAINAMGTVTTAANLDWSAYGYFTLTTTASTNVAFTFYTTASNTAGTNLASYSLGQQIRIRILAGAATVSVLSWPSTITWVGMKTGTGGSSQVAAGASGAPLVANKLADIVLTCTSTGSSPTFDGIYMIGT